MNMLKAGALSARQNGLLMLPAHPPPPVPRQSTFVFPSFNPKQLPECQRKVVFETGGGVFLFLLPSSIAKSLSLLSSNNNILSGLFCIS